MRPLIFKLASAQFLIPRSPEKSLTLASWCAIVAVVLMASGSVVFYCSKPTPVSFKCVAVVNTILQACLPVFQEVSLLVYADEWTEMVGVSQEGNASSRLTRRVVVCVMILSYGADLFRLVNATSFVYLLVDVSQLIINSLSTTVQLLIISLLDIISCRLASNLPQSTPAQCELAVDRHAQNCHLLRVLDRIFGFQILAIVSYLIFSCVTDVFVFQKSTSGVPPSIVLKTVLHVCLYVKLCFWCERIEEQTENFNYSLFRLTMKNAGPTTISSSIDLENHFSSRIKTGLRLSIKMKETTKLTAAGFFNLGFSSMTSMLAICSTYVAVLSELT